MAARLVSLEGDPSPMLLFWLHRDAIIARIEAEIDEIGDDECALTLKERSERLAEIDADRLACERAEEFWFCAAVAAGVRPDGSRETSTYSAGRGQAASQAC